MEWAVGVTTVPQRFGQLLPRTLASLKVAGFDRPRLFVDGTNDTNRYQQQFGLEVTCRYPTIRGYGNWALALGELYLRQPHASRYALFQDDIVASRGLREFLEHHYPENGYQNLITYPWNDKLANGKKGWMLSNQRGLGAQGLVFNRSAVLTLLGSKHALTKPQDKEMGWKSIDGGIVAAMNKAGWKEYIHMPSLIQHTGITSTLGNERQPVASSFRGENFDLMGLLR